MRIYSFIFVLGIVVPISNCFASVRITEIAWMGIAGANGQFGEWVELYNDTNAVIDLAGWKLYDGGGSQLVFALSKTISPNSYLLIERTTASMPDPVPDVDDEHGPFGGGGLSNDGEDLVLKDASGATVHTLSYASGWPAGDTTTKQTMQWNGSGWITAAATPGTPTSGTLEEDLVDESDEEDEEDEPAPKKYTPQITLTVPRELYRYVEYTLTADIMLENGLHPTKGPIKWNFGDGTAITQNVLAPITHRYRYPGTYTIWIAYYRGQFTVGPYLQLKKTVKVITPSIDALAVDGEAVELTNHSSEVVDLSSWQIVSGGQFAILPEGTLLASDASVTFSADTLGLSSITNVRIARPTGELMPQSTPGQTLGVSTIQIPDDSQPIEDVFAPVDTSVPIESVPTRNRTKKLIFGAAALVVLALCVLLERAMAKRE